MVQVPLTAFENHSHKPLNPLQANISLVGKKGGHWLEIGEKLPLKSYSRKKQFFSAKYFYQLHLLVYKLIPFFGSKKT